MSIVGSFCAEQSRFVFGEGLFDFSGDWEDFRMDGGWSGKRLTEVDNFAEAKFKFLTDRFR